MNRARLLAALAGIFCLAACGDPFVEAPTGAGAGGSSAASTSSGATGAGGGGGSTVATSTTSTTGSGPACVSSDACGDCMVLACEEAYCVCQPGSACAELAGCVAAFGAAPTPAQIQVCLGQNPAGIAAFMLFGDCAAESCVASVCGGEFRDLSPCEECAFAQCESDMNTCYAQKPCADLVACYSNCPPGDDACQAACQSGVSASIVTAAAAVVSCVKGPCAGSCGSDS